MFITNNSLIVRLAGVGSGGEEEPGDIVASQALSNDHIMKYDHKQARH